MSVGSGRTSRFARLSSLDRMFLHQESADWPAHFGGLAVVEGKALLDGSGQLRLQEISERVNRRLANVPQLRRRLHFPGPLGGKALWVDDGQIDIRRHVREAAVEPPGGDVQLMDAAACLYGELLDRRRPLWELWFLTGLSEGHVAVLLKLHHSVADGMAAMTIMAGLFDFEPDAPDPAAEPWAPEPAPAWRSLAADNFSIKIDAVVRAAGRVAHPLRLGREARSRIRVAREALGQTRAPRTTLNQAVRSGRRIRFLRLDLEAMKETAHAHAAKVNDVVLDLWAGGLRELMLHREEPPSGLDLITTMPVSLRSASEARTIDNELGFMTVALPVSEPDVESRLGRIVHTTRKAKSEQQSGAVAGVLAFASTIPFARSLTAHQHSVNAKVTNMIGPPVPVYVLGARVLDILPITRLFGNVGLTLAALSYAGHMSLVVTADASAFPDLDVLMAGMERDWHALANIHADRSAAVPGVRVTLQ
jgi:diacylglycerol O-acyltransferase / wax synthase